MEVVTVSGQNFAFVFVTCNITLVSNKPSMCQIQLYYYHVNQDLKEITSVTDVIMSWLSKSDFTGNKTFIMQAMRRIPLAQFGPLGSQTVKDSSLTPSCSGLERVTA